MVKGLLALLLLPLQLLSGAPEYKAKPRVEVRVIESLGEANASPMATWWLAPEPEKEPEIPEAWQRLAVCESGRYGEPTWDYDSTRYNWGNGLFDGGLQFTERTWTAFKPDGYPQYAYLATPSQQVVVGKAVAREQGAGAWPSCSAELGITTEELLR